MATRKRALNPEGTLFAFGDNVRLERGIHDPNDRESKVVWIVFGKVDVTDDPDTTYTYRFDEVSRHDEDEVGEPPEAAIAAAQALAEKE